MKARDVAGLDEFRRQCARQLRRPLAERLRFGFFRNPDPVRDSGVNRAFDTMEQYRRFCAERYPEYFGYGRPERSKPGA